jgi:hypothetical protein
MKFRISSLEPVNRMEPILSNLVVVMVSFTSNTFIYDTAKTLSSFETLAGSILNIPLHGK